VEITMRKNANIACATMLFLAGVGTCSAAEKTFPLQCASRDADVLTLIEQHAAAETLPAEQLASAFVNLLEARATCAKEGAGAGLARYEAALAPGEVSAASK